MGEWISIGQSVGKRGRNLQPDVDKIGSALVAVGVDEGGLYAVPLSVGGLGEAIENFQKQQKLPARDGKVDPTGETLKRINRILNPGMTPPAPVAPSIGGTGRIRRMASPPTDTIINKSVWAPVQDSLIRDHVFDWTMVSGRGRIEYFELDADVVPNWFGVVIPEGVKSTEHIHLFFHPTTNQAHLRDENYRSKTGWSKIFHYMTDDFAAQFCASGNKQILIMPVMDEAVKLSAGVLPAQWESICGQILALIANPTLETAEPARIATVVVSSFSAGIVYSSSFRKKAVNLGPRLKGVIDFDGIISSFKNISATLPGGHDFPVIRFFQTSDAKESQLPGLASQGFFPLARARWGGPWNDVLPKLPALAVGPLHGNIPQRFMLTAALRTAP